MFFTVYADVWLSTLRIAPNPSVCCISSSNAMFDSVIFIVFVKSEDVLQSGLKSRSNKENYEFTYVHTT